MLPKPNVHVIFEVVGGRFILDAAYASDNFYGGNLSALENVVYNEAWRKELEPMY